MSNPKHELPTNDRFQELDNHEIDELANAAAILESHEMLLWVAASRCESVAQTKRHFERVLCGIDSDDEPVEWEESTTPTEEDLVRLTVGAEWSARPALVVKQEAPAKAKSKVETKPGEEVKDVSEGIEAQTPMTARNGKKRTGGTTGTPTASSSARRSEARSQGSPYKNKKRRSEHDSGAIPGPSSRAAD